MPMLYVKRVIVLEVEATDAELATVRNALDGDDFDLLDDIMEDLAARGSIYDNDCVYVDTDLAAVRKA